MKPNRKNEMLVIALAGLAVLGLMSVQVSLLMRTATIQGRTFRNNAAAALSSIVKKLETHEILSAAGRMLPQGGDDSQRLVVYSIPPKADSTGTDFPAAAVESSRVWSEEGRVHVRLDDPVRVEVYAQDDTGRSIACLVDSFCFAGAHDWAVPDSLMRRNGLLFKVVTDDRVRVIPPNSAPGVRAGGDAGIRKTIVERVIREAYDAPPPPVEERIDFDSLDSLVAVTLDENGIDLEHAYGVVSMGRDSLILAEPPGFADALRRSEFRSRLFPHDIRVAENDIVLYFPGLRSSLFKQAGLPALVSLAFFSVLVGCYILLFRTLLAQKRFYRLLVDFINNMTHEFKTPISTISLAGETLLKPGVREDGDRVTRYGGMIRDEGARMRKQVEKILEMAALERGDFELNRERLSVHDLLKNAVERFSLRIDALGGSVETRFKAEENTVHGDVVHLANVVFNLLDNGVKYTKRAPRLVVCTRNRDGRLVLSFQDNGIGIAHEDAKKIFDKYFRVPTGDVHNVKGFGLGLSYVKHIVEAHGGHVRVRSEPGEGSEFTVELPL